jgi:WD40 repeat protein
LFDIDTGVVVHHYDTSADTYSVAFSPDGQYIVTSHGTPGDGPLARGYVTVTEIATGISPVVFEDVPQRVTYVRWSPDGSLIAGLHIGEYGEIVLWDANMGKVLQRLTEAEDVSDSELGTYFVGNISDFAWSPNDDVLAVSIELQIAFWNSATHSRNGISDYLFAIDDISWHPNEPFVAVAGGYERRIQIVDANSGQIVGVIPTSFDVMAVSWSPDGTRLAYGGKTDHLVEVTDMGSMLTPTPTGTSIPLETATYIPSPTETDTATLTATFTPTETPTNTSNWR